MNKKSIERIIFFNKIEKKAKNEKNSKNILNNYVSLCIMRTFKNE